MGIRIEHQRPTRAWGSNILYLALTVGPWLVLVWLLWPRH